MSPREAKSPAGPAERVAPPAVDRSRRPYRPRLLSVESLEMVAAACAPINPGGPGKTVPVNCASPGS
jgi:hypothetical protein